MNLNNFFLLAHLNFQDSQILKYRFLITFKFWKTNYLNELKLVFFFLKKKKKPIILNIFLMVGMWNLKRCMHHEIIII